MISVDIYVPLRKITRRISDIAPDAPQNTDAMLESLNHLIESNSNARQIQASLRAMVRGEVLQGLLFGSQEYESPEALIREYDLQLLADRPIQLCLIDGLRLPLYLECVRDGQVRCEGVIVHNEYTILFLQGEQEPQAVLDRLSAQFPAAGSWWERRPKGLPPCPRSTGDSWSFMSFGSCIRAGRCCSCGTTRSWTTPLRSRRRGSPM